MARGTANIEQLADSVRIKYNTDLAIATGRSRFEMIVLIPSEPMK